MLLAARQQLTLAVAVGSWLLHAVRVGTQLLSHIQPQPTSDHNAGDFTPLGLWRQTRAHVAVILMLTAAKTLPASKQLGSGWLICKAVF